MRAIWKGAVSFGLVSVPVKLYSATESHDVSFRQVHAKDGGRIKYQRVCSIDGEEVAYADIAKGYETEDGEMVILTDDDLAELPLTSSREIAVEKFVPASRSTRCCSRSPTTSSPRRPAPSPTPCCARRSRTPAGWPWSPSRCGSAASVAVLRVRDDVIVLQTMMWPDEIRQPDFSIETGEIKDAEVKMAHMLVETLAGDFDPAEFEDDYAERRRRPGQGQDRGRRGQADRRPRPSPPARSSTCWPRCSAPSRRPRPPAARTRTGGRRQGRLGHEEAGQEGPAKKAAAKKPAKKRKAS